MIILYITILFLTVVYTCWYLKTKMESYKKLTAANTESIQVYQFVQLHNCKDDVWPHSRSGHRTIAGNNEIWILGGYSPKDVADDEYPLFREAWVYNIWKNKWRKLADHPNMPHTLASQAVFRYSHYMIAMGGTGFPFGLDMSSNEISICDLKTEQWSQFETKGEKPEKVYGQAIALFDGSIYVYGGTSGFEYTSNLHRLNLDTRIWSKMEPKNPPEDLPPTRYRHEMVLYNGKLVVVGGGTSASAYSLSTVWVYSIDDNIWSELTTKSDLELKAYPKNRRCHSCVLYGDDAFICGGYDRDFIADDLWKLHIPTLQWTYLSKMKAPLYFHSAAVTKEGCMYIFGGVSHQDRRNNSLYRVWLRVPSLKTICFMKILQGCPELIRMTPQRLLKVVGLPPAMMIAYQGQTAATAGA